MFWHQSFFSQGASARVFINNTLWKEIALDRDNTIVLPHMVLLVKKGKIEVLHSNCPQGICKHQGWISRPGQSIVCVPNHVLIEIPGQAPSAYKAMTN